MKLRQIIQDLQHVDGSLTICAATPWSADSDAELCPASTVLKDCSLPYFLEVAVAKDVLLAWSFSRGGQMPSIEEQCRAIIYFAENDAYLLPGHDPASGSRSGH